MPEQQLLPLANPNPVDLFAPGGLSDLLERIEAQARSIVPDTSTDKGRKAIASTAARVARSKTYIDGLGKDFVAGLKKQAAVVDAERKAARDRLDALKDEVRRPLTEWEEAEDKRIQRHEQNIGQLVAYTNGLGQIDSGVLREMLNDLRETDLSPAHWDEYAGKAAQAHAEALDAMTTALALREQHEAEQAELARLRAEAAEREQREAAERAAREQAEREERIAREAEDRAKAQAEQAAKAEAERIERQRQADIERANQERIEAERRAAQAEERARIAVEQERARADAEAAAKKAEEDRRAADREHRAAVNRGAAAAITAHVDISAAQAQSVIVAIARGDVPSVHIHY